MNATLSAILRWALCLLTIWAGPAATVAATVGGNPATMAAVQRVRDALTGNQLTSSTNLSKEPTALAEIVSLDDGTIRYLCAHPGQHFRVAEANRSDPDANARRFLAEHATAFGLSSGSVSNLVTARVAAADGRHFVKLSQVSEGLRVFGAQSIVQINSQDGVEYVVNHLARHLGAKTTAAKLTAADAAAKARQLVADAAAGYPVTNGTPELVWFVPDLVGLGGPARLAWRVQVLGSNPVMLNADLFVDADTGEQVFQYSRSCTALFRTIFDAKNDVAWPPQFPKLPPVPARLEGGPTSSLGDVNNAYDGIGDAYNFYLAHHGRHGLSGSDLPIFAVVRVCVGGQACPWPNAAFTGLPDPPFVSIPGQTINEGILAFGDGWTTDDIVAHEYTHGVTAFESGLIYANASGAINEAFSDIWGEFVDWGNGRGNDSASVKWDVAEDLSTGRIRSMSDPPARGDPDRLGSSKVVAPNGSPNLGNDYGGVHSNSGIVNKLCYLLTDGDTFNGYTVAGLGMTRVVDLFYEVNAHLLPGTADYTDLAVALHQGARNLGWNASDIANLHRACLAVEINGNYVDKSNGNVSPNGCRQAGLGAGGPFPTLAQGIAAVQTGDPLYVRGTATHYNERLRITKTMTLRAYGGTAVIGRP